MNLDNFPKKEIESNAIFAVPSMLLYGNRFHSDQPSIELLAEFLMVLNAEKRINGDEAFDEIFPKNLNKENFKDLSYSVNHRLYFKLFSLWTSGKHPKASESHATEYKTIMKNMARCFPNSDTPERNLEILSNLYQGFQVAGASRDWSSRSFLPISKNLITGESIWRATSAQNARADDFESNKIYFTHNDRDFYSRGGEVLYLQLLAAFTKSKEEVKHWFSENDCFKEMKRSEEEMDPLYLKRIIEIGFRKMYDSNTIPSGFDAFINLVEKKNQKAEHETFNYSENISVGCIPYETWYLGYLFALDLSRLFKSKFDAIDLLRYLEIECTLQSLRTVIFQSSKYLLHPVPLMAIVSATCDNQLLKTVSKRSLDNTLKCVRSAFEKIAMNDEICQERLHGYYNDLKRFNDIHKDNGYKMLRKHAKEIGFIIPPKGGNEHFVLSKNMLILLVSTTLAPNESLTVESFLSDLKVRWGFVFDCDGFTKANQDAGFKQMISDSTILDWLIDMLNECGYFIPLSDAISLVKNNNISAGV